MIDVPKDWKLVPVVANADLLEELDLGPEPLPEESWQDFNQRRWTAILAVATEYKP